jgi:NIPSNAP
MRLSRRPTALANGPRRPYPTTETPIFRRLIMKRRSFIKMSVAAVGSAAAGSAAADEAKTKTTELYELCVWSLAVAKQPIVDQYLEKAFIPALKRYGIGPVGAFVEKTGKDQVKLYALIVYPSADAVVTLPGRLAADEEYLKAAGEYLAAPAKEPIYARIDSSLLTPIGGMPKLEKPDTSKPRLLNLRVYESHNERAARKKIEMFNKAELAIFRRVGLTPVLFGETVVGAAMPNLTYLLVFPDEAGRTAAWSRFGEDADWKKLRAVPEYDDKEIVSGITNKILTPTAFSQI